jgi:hypothetical protein
MVNERRQPSDPDGSRTAQVSNLEHVFGFRDLAFRQYMTLGRTKDASPRLLKDLASEMAEHGHPIVRYAGAWAVAEAGMFRLSHPGLQSRPNTDSLPDRLQSLETAQGMWGQAAIDFGNLRGATTRPELQNEYLGFELRAMQSLTYIPSMQLTATLMSDFVISEQDRDGLLQRTRQRLASLGEVVLDLKGNGQGFFDVRSGICNEILGGLLLQESHDSRYVIIPASVRQDNHAEASMRADLIAVNTKETHPRTLIQISSRMDQNQVSKERFIVHTWSDLTLEGQRPRDTLRRVIEKEKGGKTTYISSQIDSLSQSLTDRLAAFTPHK